MNDNTYTSSLRINLIKFCVNAMQNKITNIKTHTRVTHERTEEKEDGAKKK